MTQRYKLTSGIHYERNPNADPKNRHDPGRDIKYKKGDVITSDRELDQIYVNKFEKVVENQQGPVSEQRKKDVEELLSGTGWQEEDRAFLESLSDDGFERIKRHNDALPQTASTKEEPKEEGKEGKKIQSVLGEDVTDKHPAARQAGLAVFRNAQGKFQVAKTRSPAKPLHPSPLDNDKAVDGFVEEYSMEK